MCEWNKYGDTRIDPCLRNLVTHLKQLGIETLACCCGHGKYDLTIIVRMNYLVFDLCSNKRMIREKRFYKRDDKGHYYIPELQSKYTDNGE